MHRPTIGSGRCRVTKSIEWLSVFCFLPDHMNQRDRHRAGNDRLRRPSRRALLRRALRWSIRKWRTPTDAGHRTGNARLEVSTSHAINGALFSTRCNRRLATDQCPLSVVPAFQQTATVRDVMLGCLVTIWCCRGNILSAVRMHRSLRNLTAVAAL